MVIPYAENITKTAKLNIKNTGQTRTPKFNRLNRYVKVHKDTVSREQSNGVVYKL